MGQGGEEPRLQKDGKEGPLPARGAQRESAPSRPARWSIKDPPPPPLRSDDADEAPNLDAAYIYIYIYIHIYNQALLFVEGSC